MSAKNHWTADKISELIALYERNQCLWNFHTEEYKNRMKRDTAVRKICNQLDISKDQFAKKIHNLRNQYNFELKKLQKRNAGLDGGGNEYTCRWDYFEQLSFLRNYISHRFSSSILEQKPTVQIDEEEPTASETIDEITTEYEIQPDETHLQTTHDICPPKVPPPRQTPHAGLTQIEVNGQQYTSFIEQQSDESCRVSLATAKDVIRDTSNFIGYIEQSPAVKRARTNDRNDVSVRDECTVFGDFVANEMRSLNSDVSRRKLKRRIMQAILEVGNEDDGVNINISLN